MASSINKVTILGNLGADPEVKAFQNGNRIANVRIATSESWTDKQTGERRERTEWHSVTIDNEHLVRFAEQHLRKGSRVYLEGQLRTRKWQDRDGNDRYTTEIVVGRFKGELVGLDARQSNGGRSDEAQNGTSNYSSPGSDLGDYDDDVPF